jgi:hypothetical protein
MTDSGPAAPAPTDPNVTALAALIGEWEGRKPPDTVDHDFAAWMVRHGVTACGERVAGSGPDLNNSSVEDILDYYGVPRCGDPWHRINELGQMYRRAVQAERSSNAAPRELQLEIARLRTALACIAEEASRCRGA